MGSTPGQPYGERPVSRFKCDAAAKLASLTRAAAPRNLKSGSPEWMLKPIGLGTKPLLDPFNGIAAGPEGGDKAILAQQVSSADGDEIHARAF